MQIKIALAGNPNSGKTTLFNALTGSNQYVGNWPGVTVEKKEGKIKGEDDVILTDLPGVYSLSPYTMEEVVARDYLIGERPDAILNIVDGTNLERNLYLTTQLMEIGIPVVIAVNMLDAVKKRGDVIDIAALSRELGCPVFEISALKGVGIDEVARAAIEVAGNGKFTPHHVFSGEVEHALAHIEEAVVHEMPEAEQRWYAVKVFERDEKVLDTLKIPAETLAHIERDIVRVEEKMDDDAVSVIINERYDYIGALCRRCFVKKSKSEMSYSDRIDGIVTHRMFALPIFAAVMFLVYFISIGSIGELSVTFMNDILFGTWIIPPLTAWLTSIGCAPWLVSLVGDGIVSGVGSVLGFVPQMLILFCLLALLEDCGYMSRVAFIMDKIFRKFGLSGKSFIPLLVGTGCSVPAIMTSRTIDQLRDRRMTVMTTAFMPCGAKMPIVGMIAGALFGGSALVATSAYFIGVGAVIVSGVILKKTKPFAGKPAPFVMELPAYHAPLASNILRTTWERGWSFIKRAGTVILAASIIIWTMNSLSFVGGLHYITEERGGASILQNIGVTIAWLFVPLGFGNWQAAVATILGILAKEQVVGTFGTLSSMADSALALEGNGAMYAVIAEEFFGGSALRGFSFMVFNLLCAPCIGAMGAIRREMNSKKWTAFAIGYMCVVAYAASFVIYQLGAWFEGAGSVLGTELAVLVLAFAIYMLVRKNPYGENGERVRVKEN